MAVNMNILRNAHNIPEDYVFISASGVGLEVPMPARLAKVRMTANPHAFSWPRGNSITLPQEELYREGSVTNLVRHVLGDTAAEVLRYDQSSEILEVPDEKADIWLNIGQAALLQYRALGIDNS